MAFIQDGRTVAGNAAIENITKAQRVAIVPRSQRNYAIAATTGTIAAALAVNSTIFAMRISLSSGNILAFIDRVRIQYTTVVAYTVPVTAGRRLAYYRGSAAAATGGTAIVTVFKKDSTGTDSFVVAAQGGDARVATTGALTVAGIVYETNQCGEVSLTHVGAAGASIEHITEFSSDASSPVILQPGQLFAVRNPVVFDAAGTWQATVTVEWHEALAYASSTADS